MDDSVGGSGFDRVITACFEAQHRTTRCTTNADKP